MVQVNPNQFLASLRFADALKPTDDEKGRRARFLEVFPEHEASVYSYQANPQCSCANDILKGLAVEDYKRLRDNLHYIIGEPAELIIPRWLTGEIHILASDEAYTTLVREVQRQGHFYRGVAVIPGTDGSLKLYFY